MIERIYLISHSHIDLGYTDHPESLWPFFNEILIRAMDLIEMTRDYPPEAQFRYTCEVLCVIDHFLRTAPTRQIDRLLEHEKAGLFDVGAMWAHFTPLITRAEMNWTMDQVKRLRQTYGLSLKSAMNTDINGLSWAWVDALVDAEVSGFTMAINESRGRNPKPRRGFWWQGPGGQKLLTWCGEMYNWGRWFGIPQDISQASARFQDYLRSLENENYPYPFAALQVTGELHWGDNNWPSEHVSDFVSTWNKRQYGPRFEIVTLSQFLNHLRDPQASTMEVIRGDWPDWWAFGVGSMARETSLLRQTQNKLETCRSLFNHVKVQPQTAVDCRFEEATRLCVLYDEHTFAADEASHRPHSAFSVGSAIRKANYVYDAATIAEEIHQRLGNDLRGQLGVKIDQGLLFNPHERSLTQSLPLSSSYAASNRRSPPPVAPNDFSRAFESGYETPIVSLQPGESCVSALPEEQPIRWQSCVGMNDLVLGRARVSLSDKTGAIVAWDAGKTKFPLDSLGLNCLVFETVKDEDGRRATWIPYDGCRMDGFGRHGGPEILDRRTPQRVISIERGTAGNEQLLRVCVELQHVGEASIVYRFHADGLGVDIVNQLELPPLMTPWSLYSAFMPRLEPFEFWYDSGGAPTRGDEQIVGSCHDYVCIGDWAGISSPSHSLLVVSPDVPLMQMGGFNYLKIRKTPSTDGLHSQLVSWVANNHWEVNFPVQQSGRLFIRYHVRWIDGPVDGEKLTDQSMPFTRQLCWFPLTRWCVSPSSKNRIKHENNV